MDRRLMRAPLERAFDLAADVERWPELLQHYRWVHFLERGPGDGGLVEMAAWRRFGPVPFPTWWVSRMVIDRVAPAIRYRHVRGITRGMDVEWAFAPSTGGVEVSITHVWDGPSWPLVGGPVSKLVIGPVFIHRVAQRTLAGIARAAEEGQ